MRLFFISFCGISFFLRERVFFEDYQICYRGFSFNFCGFSMIIANFSLIFHNHFCGVIFDFIVWNFHFYFRFSVYIFFVQEDVSGHRQYVKSRKHSKQEESWKRQHKYCFITHLKPHCFRVTLNSKFCCSLVLLHIRTDSTFVSHRICNFQF